MNYQDDRAVITGFSKKFAALESLRKNWGWFLALGILFVLLGLLAISSASYVTDIYVIFLGALLLVAGIAQIVYAFWSRRWSGFFLSLLAGILYSVIGFIFIKDPTLSAITLTLILGALFVVGGIFRIVGAAMMRFEEWGWALFSGLVKLALGILILNGWPQIGLWVIGLFVGIDLIFYGWFWILLALTARRIDNKTI